MRWLYSGEKQGKDKWAGQPAEMNEDKIHTYMDWSLWPICTNLFDNYDPFCFLYRTWQTFRASNFLCWWWSKLMTNRSHQSPLFLRQHWPPTMHLWLTFSSKSFAYTINRLSNYCSNRWPILDILSHRYPKLLWLASACWDLMASYFLRVQNVAHGREKPWRWKHTTSVAASSSLWSFIRMDSSIPLYASQGTAF